MIVKTEDANYGRDTATNAVINTNASAYQLYKQQRSQLTTVHTLQKEVNSLKTDIGEIKQLLGQLIQNVSINR
jgi:hypothetical protein